MIELTATVVEAVASLPESLAGDAGEVGETDSPKMSKELSAQLENLPGQIGEFDWLDSLPLEIGEPTPSEVSVFSDKLGLTVLSNADVESAGILSNTSSDGRDSAEDEAEKKGGSYRDVYKKGEGSHSEVHHIPADAASPLDRNDGPAIKMENGDHRQTASCGNSREAREYRAKQADLISQGKFREAAQMDIDDIRDKFGDKYDDAIAEMLEYIDKLESEGKIDA